MRWLSVVLILSLCCTACGSKTKESLYAEGLKQLEASNPGGAVVYLKSALEKDGNFNDARFQLAKAYAALGKLEQAEKEYSKVLRQNPQREDALLQLAAVLNEEGKGDEAFKLGEGYLVKHPQAPEGLEVLGISCAVGKKYQDAENYLSLALKRGGNSSRLKLELSLVYAATDRGEQARLLLGEIVRSEPKNLKALYLLAGMEKTAGNTERAEGLYRQILGAKASEIAAQYKLGLIQIEKGELERADLSADDLIKRFPKRGDGYRLKGLVSFQRKRYPEAISSLQSSLKSTPTYEAYYFLGLSFYNQGELESALSQFRVILDRLPKSRQARLMTAQTLLRQKRVDDAIAEINKLLQNDGSDPAAHDLLGTAYMAQGLFEEGMRELNLANRIDPKLVSAHVKKGYYYFSKGRESQGESELASAVQVAPDLLDNRLLLASYHLRQKNTAKAIAILKSGLSGGRKDAPLYNALAVAEFSANNRSGGIGYLEKAKRVDSAFAASYQNLATYYAATGDYQKAIAEYGSLLRVDRSSWKAMLGLAALYEITGKDAEALAQYQKATQTGAQAAFLAEAAYLQKKGGTDRALKVLDEASKLDPRGYAALEMKGRLLVAAKRYREALKVFDQVEAINQDQGIPLKIQALLGMGDGAEAVRQARRVIAKAPTSGKGYLLLASVYKHQKDAASALREAGNAIKADPANVEARVFLGDLLAAGKAYDKAMAAYQDALRVKPDDLAAQFARAALLDETGRKKDAARIYRSILDRADNFIPALNNLAYLCAEGFGSKEESLRLAINALKLEPGNGGVMDTVGYALLKNGRKGDAVKVLERAATLVPEEPSIRYHLALAYKESGDRSRAAQSAQKALALGGGADGKAARQLLAELGS